ncbi:MAG: hypothetical protein ABI564_06495 [Ideonella sp.]
MATLNFRLPANRSDLRTQRRSTTAQRPSQGAQLGSGLPAMKTMDAEAAALIALRRLGARELQLQLLEQPASDIGVIASSGWFDSTWELANGLDIAEGMPSDLPLDGWLQFYLAA